LGLQQKTAEKTLGLKSSSVVCTIAQLRSEGLCNIRLGLEYFNFIFPCYSLAIGVEMVPEDRIVRQSVRIILATRTVSQGQDTWLILTKLSLSLLFEKWDIVSPAGRRVVESFWLASVALQAGSSVSDPLMHRQTVTQPQRVWCGSQAWKSGKGGLRSRG
jgi:hypothetical protein